MSGVEEDPSCVLAIDIGGTTLKGAVFDAQGQQRARHAAPTFGAGGDPYRGVVQLLETLRDDAIDGGRVPKAIGIGTPGLVDTRHGVVRYAANLGWRDLALGELLEHLFQLPVSVDHDARASARAEIASRPDVRDLIVIPIGTGLSAAMVVDGRIVFGHTGSAGEFGHMPVVPGGDRCACGQLGCLEAYASAGGILNRYVARGGRNAKSTAQIPGLLATDPIARAVWDEAIDALATGVTALSAVFDPQEVVIGGGLAKSGDALLTPLRRAVEGKLNWRESPPISLSTIGLGAGLVGAALMAWECRPDTSTRPVTAERRIDPLLAASRPASP